MQVPIPFVDETINLSDPQDAVTTAVLVVVGFALFYVHRSLGAELANSIESTLGLEDSPDGVDIL